MPTEVEKSSQLLNRAERLLERLEAALRPGPTGAPDWSAIAYRWRGESRPGRLQPVANPRRVELGDLLGIDQQKSILARNTEQFVHRLPCNNALLWGARGTGKSSLVKALLHQYAGRGLRLVEVDAHHLVDLPDLLELLAPRPERFVVFCDDLSFSAEDPSYRALKAILEGSVATSPENAVIYATSNRRHLMPEFMQENLETSRVGEEIHPGETVEEKISLSERFGIWLSFHPFRQEQYLDIVGWWLSRLGQGRIEFDADLREQALRWALKRGSRSGRVARQFANDVIGARRLRAAELVDQSAANQMSP